MDPVPRLVELAVRAEDHRAPQSRAALLECAACDSRIAERVARALAALPWTQATPLARIQRAKSLLDSVRASVGGAATPERPTARVLPFALSHPEWGARPLPLRPRIPLPRVLRAWREAAQRAASERADGVAQLPETSLNRLRAAAGRWADACVVRDNNVTVACAMVDEAPDAWRRDALYWWTAWVARHRRDAALRSKARHFRDSRRRQRGLAALRWFPAWARRERALAAAAAWHRRRWDRRRPVLLWRRWALRDILAEHARPLERALVHHRRVALRRAWALWRVRTRLGWDRRRRAAPARNGTHRARRTVTQATLKRQAAREAAARAAAGPLVHSYLRPHVFVRKVIVDALRAKQRQRRQAQALQVALVP